MCNLPKIVGGTISFKTQSSSFKINNLIRFLLCYVLNDMPKITPTILLDKRGLRGQRFHAWYHHIENVSKMNDILYVLKQSPPRVSLTKLASKEDCQNYTRHFEDDLQAKSLILTALSKELKQLHEHMDTSCAMVDSLHKMHDIETSNIRFSNVCNLMTAKMARGTSV